LRSFEKCIMKNRSLIRFIQLLGISFILGFYACDENIEYSPIPAITYKSCTVIDSVDILGNSKLYVKLLFSIIDGDGDMGLSENDTIAPYVDEYQNNFFSTVFYVTDGGYDSTEISDYNYRIPYIEIENHRAYKAEVTVEFEYFENQLQGDSIAYQFYVVDRSLNHSDTLMTPGIALTVATP